MANLEKIVVLGEKLWEAWKKSFLKRFQRLYSFFNRSPNFSCVMGREDIKLVENEQ